MKEKINKLQQDKKQKLTATLQEIGMTINEVKGWLRDVSGDYPTSVNRDYSYKNKLMKDLFKDSRCTASYSEAINCLYDDIKNLDNEPCETPCTSPKSNVTFIPGTAQTEALLLVGGVQVLGDYKLNYLYNTVEKKGILQVEFIDPI
jgi:hypothetical protein